MKPKPMTPRPINEQRIKSAVAQHVTRGERLCVPADDSLTQTGWIKTFTGKMVQPLALVPDDIDIRDIAHGLARICRFNGQCNGFLNVAAHSMRVLHRFTATNPDATNQAKLTALMHDAAEAYLGDLPRPLKRHPAFAFYREIEAEAEAVIAEKFGLIYPFPLTVKVADNEELAEDLQHRRYQAHDESASLSEAEFLHWFERLGK